MIRRRFLLLLFSFMLFAVGGFAQQSSRTITGKITDKETGEPLIGVSILAQEGREEPVAIGITDGNGNYSVNVSKGTNLIYRYVGYLEYNEIVQSNESSKDIQLTVNQTKLDETVIIGYHKKTRALTTGSSVKISGAEIQDIPVSNAEQLLQGRVAGLNIQNNTGSPGARGSVAIRGVSNINITGNGNDAFLTPTSPLYVIDGVPVEPDADFSYGYESTGPGVSPLSLIPPEDIQEIEVLKDAQATALYGSRGAYGVILVTTIRGSSPIPLVRYTSNYFVNTVPKLRSVIGGNLERNIRIQTIMKNGTVADVYNISSTPFLADSLNPYYNNSTNWQDIFYRTTYNTTQNINISGGDPKFNYKADLDYYKENGVIKNTGFERYSLGTNMQYNPDPRLRIFNTLSVQLGKRNLGSGNSLLQTGVASSGATSSLLPPPSFFLSTSDYLSTVGTENDNKTLTLRASTDIQYQIFEGFSVATSLSYDYSSNTQDKFKPAAANNEFSQMYAYDSRDYTLYNRNTLTYFYSINKEHNFTISAFNEIYNKGFQAHVLQQERTPSDQYHGPVGFDGGSSRGGGLLDNYNRIHTASFAGFLNYDYKKKYVLNATYRMDGSSSSGFENPYSKNPSLGLRWNFSNENFLKDDEWLSYGSIRTSWGQNIVPSGDLFSIYGSYYPRGHLNQQPRVGISFVNLPNPNLKPTTTAQYNIGFEGGLFGGRLEVIFDTYYKTVKNQLREKEIADITGFDNVQTNETALVDYGYELTMTYHLLRNTKNITWSFSVNGAYNKDILTQLPDGKRQLVQFDSDNGQDILFHVGRNSLSNYLYKTLGVYETDEDVPVDPASGLRYRMANGEFFKAGDPYWEDKDENYVFDGSDRSPVGNSQPLITGGIQSYLTYKNFSFNFSASFIAKRDILNNALAERLAFMSDPFSQTAVLNLPGMNFWSPSVSGDIKGIDEQPDVSTSTYPNPFDFNRYKAIDPFRWEQSLYQEDGSYFKINTITLAYKLNEEIVRQLGLRTIRLYLSANNIATFSSYSGPNPENVTPLGRDRSDGYPIPTSWNVGVNVEF